MSRYDSKISSGLNSGFQEYAKAGCTTCQGNCKGGCSGSCTGFCSGGCRAVCYIGVYKFLSLTGESDAKSR